MDVHLAVIVCRMEKSVFVDVHERSLGAVVLARERIYTTRAYQVKAARQHYYRECPTTAGTDTSGYEKWRRRGTPTANKRRKTSSNKKGEGKKKTPPEEAMQPAQGTGQRSETTLTDEVILRRAERNAPEHQARTGVAAPAPARRSSRRTAVHNASKEGKVQHAGASQSRRSRVGPAFQCAIPEVGAGRERLMAAQKGSGAGYPNLGQTCYLGACIQAIRHTLSLHEGIVEAKARSKGGTPLLNALIGALTKPSKKSVKRLTGLRVHKDSYASNAEHDAGEYLTFLRCA